MRRAGVTPTRGSPPHDAAGRAAEETAKTGAALAAERRPITVMFCDLVGSTGLAARLDAEDWRNLVGAYLDEASNAVTGLGGHVLKKLGDGLMALFGYPQAQENDAERAVRAALAISSRGNGARHFEFERRPPAKTKAMLAGSRSGAGRDRR